MTRTDLIKSKIAEARTSLAALNTLTETEKRVKTADERTKFDGFIAEIQSLEAELKDIEAVERIKIEAPSIITSADKAKNRVYSLSRALIGLVDNKLSGLELEVHEEMKRMYPESNGLLVPDELIYKRTETLANSGGLVQVGASSMDIISQPSMYEKMGVTVYRNLTGTYKLNFAQGLTAEPMAELQPYTGKTYNKVTDTLSPVAFGYQVTTTKEALTVADMTAEMYLDADAATGAAITKAIFVGLNANTGVTLTGYASTNSATTITSKTLGLLRTSVLSALFRKPAYALGASIFGELEETQAATILRTIITDGKLSGYDAYNVMSLLGVHDTNKYDIVFGDMSRAYVGLWGGFEILVNPYSLDSTRQIRLTFTRMADTAINPFAFKAIHNAKLA